MAEDSYTHDLETLKELESATVGYTAIHADVCSYVNARHLRIATGTPNTFLSPIIANVIEGELEAALPHILAQISKRLNEEKRAVQMRVASEIKKRA